MIRTLVFQFQKLLLISLHQQTLFIQMRPPITQDSEHNANGRKLTLLENINRALDRPVSTRLQLHEQALFCYYDAFLTSVEPKNYKDALTQACWIEAMQEELQEFERDWSRILPWSGEFSKLDEDKDGNAVDPIHTIVDPSINTSGFHVIKEHVNGVSTFTLSYGVQLATSITKALGEKE
ncbi:hypothetical protein Tco_0180472 [Tanacetum coccineum]